MRSTTSHTPQPLVDGVDTVPAGRVRSALGTRGQRSHPARPHADVHRIFRLQPPPFV